MKARLVNEFNASFWIGFCESLNKLGNSVWTLVVSAGVVVGVRKHHEIIRGRQMISGRIGICA